MSSTLDPFHPSISHRKRTKTPSFSSILLDAIYRSIDDDHNHGEYPHTTPTSPIHSIVKQNDCASSKQRRTKMKSDSTLETVDLRRAIMIESWMEKQPHQQPQQQQRKHFNLGDVIDRKIKIVRQKSVPNRARVLDESSSSNDLSSCFTNLTPRSSRDQLSSSRIFTKTKSRALKIYGDFKKSKQQNTPISPGRRIAAFLNSIFRNSGNSPARNSPEIKINPSPPPTTTTTSNSTCSSASSFSRSCLSNKTSSSGKSTRSVRFYPISVIVDEDSRPCGHKSLLKNENEEPKKLVSPRPTVNNNGEYEQRREKEIDTLLMMIKNNSNSKNNHKNHRRHVSSFVKDHDQAMEEDEDDDDDGDSCASSDLFELENFSAIGGGATRYCEELPVYGTTSLEDITA
ncbi:unnamed protein product [Amaranthus hypochondriacus]